MMVETSPQQQQQQQSLHAPPLQREQSYDALDFEGEGSDVVSSGTNEFGSDSLTGDGQEQETHQEGGSFVEEPLSDGGSESGGLEPVSESGEEAEATANSYGHRTQAGEGGETEQGGRGQQPTTAGASASARRLSTEFDDSHTNELFLDDDQADGLNQAALPTIVEPPHSPATTKKSEHRGSPARARSARAKGPNHSPAGSGKHAASRSASQPSPRPKSAPTQWADSSSEGDHARAGLNHARKGLQHRPSHHLSHVAVIEKTIKRLETTPVSRW